MEIIKITNEKDKAAMELALEYLRQGKVIAYPTETVYGLGCDATNRRAVNKIYKIKGKAEKKALLFLVSSLAMAKKYLAINKTARVLIKQHWPGALSLILPLTSLGRQAFKRSDGGVRISSNPIATALVKKLGQPIISTSANPTDQPAARTAQEVVDYFKDSKHKPDLILDAGKLKKSKGSTIIRVAEGKIEVLREGDVKFLISKL